MEGAVARLDHARAVDRVAFPPPGLGGARGLYAWFVDGEGAEGLGEGLRQDIRRGLVFVGQAGAAMTRSGRPSRTTLRSRVEHQFTGDIRSSAFRFTIAAALRSSPLVVPVGPRRLTIESEHVLSGWIAQHLRVAVCETDPEILVELERDVVRALDPPLNLDGVDATPVREAVTHARAELARFARRSAVRFTRAPALPRSGPAEAARS